MAGPHPTKWRGSRPWWMNMRHWSPLPPPQPPRRVVAQGGHSRGAMAENEEAAVALVIVIVVVVVLLLRVHPIDLEEDPAVVAGLLILYLKVLPHPVVPPKFFITVASLTAMKNTHDKLSQLRIFIHKLPPVCRAIVFQLISLFSEARLPPDHITQVFGPSILSPTVEPCGIAPWYQHFFSLLCAHSEYLNLHLEMPILDKEAESEAPDDFKLQAVVLFEFTNNWLYAKVDQTNKEGLVPSGHIEMRPVNRW
ncbi:hypothetical protein Pelo_982 [Pelomyxa schiedti]|nr:hypothetical protein Pelo_982 [Pelomyxa schiedti]